MRRVCVINQTELSNVSKPNRLSFVKQGSLVGVARACTLACVSLRVVLLFIPGLSFYRVLAVHIQFILLFIVVHIRSCNGNSWDGIMGDVECQKALVAKLLGYLLILGSLTVKAPQVNN